MNEDSSMEQRLEMNEDSSMEQRLEMNEDSSMEQRLEMNEDSSMEQRLEMNEDSSMEQRLEMNEDSSMEQRLEMNKDSSMEQRTWQVYGFGKRSMCFTCRPCLWCQYHRLLGTKWQYLESCFCNFQTLILTSRMRNQAKKCCVYIDNYCNVSFVWAPFLASSFKLSQLSI